MQTAKFNCYVVPGLPHLLQPSLNSGYAKLADAIRQVGRHIADAGCERIVYYSTGWLSVLGTSFQAKQRLSGLHVDENWHDFGDLPFDFKVDQGFAQAMARRVKEAGFATALVDFEGFPVDTGTIVADRLINSKHLPVAMVSSHVYLDYDGTKKLGRLVAETASQTTLKTAFVAVTSLSTRYFTEALDYSKDQIRDAEDDRWNRRMLESLETGDWRSFEAAVPEFSQKAKGDMGLKAFGFVQGAMSSAGRGQLKCYGSIYGTGAAVIEFG